MTPPSFPPLPTCTPSSPPLLPQPQPSPTPPPKAEREESKEQPPRTHHSRPPSIQIHHRPSPSLLSAGSVSPLPPTSPSPLPPTSRSPLTAAISPTSASHGRTSLRRLFGRSTKGSVVPFTPFTPSPRQSALEGSEGGCGAGREEKEESGGWHARAKEEGGNGRVEEEKEEERVKDETTATPAKPPSHHSHASIAWSNPTHPSLPPNPSALDFVLPFSPSDGLPEASQEDPDSRARARSTLSRRRSLLPEPSIDTPVDEHSQLERKYEEEEDGPASVPPVVVGGAVPGAVEGGDEIPDLFSDLVISALPPVPSADFPPHPSHLQSLLLPPPLPPPFPPPPHPPLHLHHYSLPTLRSSSLDLEHARLDAIRAELHEGKEREWRVWKEEQRVRHLLDVEDAKRGEVARVAEEAMWTGQRAAMEREVDAYRRAEQRMRQSLRGVATVTTIPLETLSPPVVGAGVEVVPPVPPLRARYMAEYVHRPRLLSVQVHALRAVKEKLPAGMYTLRLSILPHLGSAPLTFHATHRTLPHYPASTSTPSSQHHPGTYADVDLSFAQPSNHLLLACPAAADTRAEMALRLEVVGAEGEVRGWGAFPLVREGGG